MEQVLQKFVNKDLADIIGKYANQNILNCLKELNFLLNEYRNYLYQFNINKELDYAEMIYGYYFIT